MVYDNNGKDMDACKPLIDAFKVCDLHVALCNSASCSHRGTNVSTSYTAVMGLSLGSRGALQQRQHLDRQKLVGPLQLAHQ